MTSEGGTGKVCVICGEDCANKPRTKDAKGHYYCRACYDDAMNRKQHAAPPAQEFGISLENLVPMQASCPSCGRVMKEGSVLCTNCGYNVQSGFRMAPPSAVHAAVKASAPWFMSPVYLYLMPAKFFRNFVNASPALTALFAWVFGVAGMIDRIDTRMIMAHNNGRPAPIPDSWTLHWVIFLLGGVLAGALYYAIGGWWYRVRLKWSGATSIDAALARRVYILASLVYAFPAILLKLVETARFNTPTAAAAGDLGILDLLLLATIIWSVWTSYMGVRTVFTTGRVRALIWFLILPLLVYLAAIAGVVAMMFITYGGPVDTTNPAVHRSSSMVFSYPKNWLYTASDPNFDVVVEPALHDAYVSIQMYESTDSLEVELQATIDLIQSDEPSMRETSRFDRWGNQRGSGVVLEGTSDGRRYLIRIFVSSLPNGNVLEVLESTSMDDREDVEPGFELIRSSFFSR